MARIAKPLIEAVEPESIAWRLGIRPGDKLMAINGQPVRDELDYRFLLAEEHLELKVVRGNGETVWLAVAKEFDEELGVDFGGKATFDGIYTCHNNCVFCFVQQQPRGLRPTLTLMDDDYRLSYMHGNFITLVGMAADQWQRIFDQHLSPMYISVHATDDDLRAKLMGTDGARGIMNQLRELAEGGIQFHTQIVTVPGLNDGDALERTIADLSTLGPHALLSVSVVPVGLTRYREGLALLRRFTAAEAGRVVDQVEAWQRKFLPEWSTVLLYPSDEWYLLAGREVPPAEAYGNYDQLENGVGMVRLFLEQMKATTARLPESLPAPRRVTVVTGALATPILEQAAAWLESHVRGLSVRVVTALNDFYGHGVTVTGLLLARDQIAYLKGAGEPGDLVILPAVAYRDLDGRSLDNMTLPEVSQALGGVAVALAGTPAELADQATGGLLLPERKKFRGKALRFRHHGEAGAVNLLKEERPK